MRRKKKGRSNGNSFLCSRRATTVTTTIPKRSTLTLFYQTTYHLAQLPFEMVRLRTYSHNHARMLRTALEKLDLCRLLDMLYVDIHDSFMDFNRYDVDLSEYDIISLLFLRRKLTNQFFSYLKNRRKKKSNNLFDNRRFFLKKKFQQLNSTRQLVDAS